MKKLIYLLLLVSVSSFGQFSRYRVMFAGSPGRIDPLHRRPAGKELDDVVAVDAINLRVNEGEVFGFLGPNGAGKTTAIGMALGLIRPTAGYVEIFGQKISPDHTKPLRQVGSLVGAPALIPYLSGQGNLLLLARLHPEVDDRRVNEVLDQVRLTDAAGRKVRGYSTGMKQRMG